jgi:hypothetical protein
MSAKEMAPKVSLSYAQDMALVQVKFKSENTWETVLLKG